MKLSFKGTPFCGWQRQPNGVSVQGVLEEALSTLLHERIAVTGCGRTDAGVHADYYTAHFDSSQDKLNGNDDFLYHLNGILPREIVVFVIAKMSFDAHARYDALYREYTYRIACEKNPFNTEVAYPFFRPLDFDLMNDAAAIMLDYDDFTSFCKLHGNSKNNLCKITYAHWNNSLDLGERQFVICANRFLRGMVRAIVGTLLDIGIGRYPPEAIRHIIKAKDRSAAGASVPALGLHLSFVAYPYDNSSTVKIREFCMRELRKL